MLIVLDFLENLKTFSLKAIKSICLRHNKKCPAKPQKTFRLEKYVMTLKAVNYL